MTRPPAGASGATGDGRTVVEVAPERRPWRGLPPTPLQQAKEAARDNPSLSELADILLAVDGVTAHLYRADDPLEQSLLTVTLLDSSVATRDVITVVERAGWTVDDVIWSRQELHCTPWEGRA